MWRTRNFWFQCEFCGHVFYTRKLWIEAECEKCHKEIETPKFYIKGRSVNNSAKKIS